MLHWGVEIERWGRAIESDGEDVRLASLVDVGYEFSRVAGGYEQESRRERIECPGMSDLFDAENLPESRDSSEARDPNRFIDEEKHSTTVLKIFEEFDEEFIPAEFDIFVREGEKEN